VLPGARAWIQLITLPSLWVWIALIVTTTRNQATSRR